MSLGFKNLNIRGAESCLYQKLQYMEHPIAMWELQWRETETIILLYIISLHVSAFLKNHHQALYNIK